MSASSWALASWKETGQSVIEVQLIRPIRGFGAIVNGLALAGSELIQAVVAAALEAVQAHLGEHGRAKVREGIDQVRAGAQAMAVPFTVALGIWICWNLGILRLASVAWVLGLTLCLAVD